jgi:N-acetylglucosamine malate deacetylase 1
VENTWENRLKIARVIRHTRPRVVILPYWKGRHPDHYTASKLGYEACFLAGLAKLAISPQPSTVSSEESEFRKVASTVAGDKQGLTSARKADKTGRGGNPTNREISSNAGGAPTPHRPFKIIYATLYYDVRPTFVVDISEQFEARFESLMAYKSQFSDQEAGKDIFPARNEIRARIDAMARFYGMMAGVTYAEPFLQKEVGVVDDVTALPVKSI